MRPESLRPCIVDEDAKKETGCEKGYFHMWAQRSELHREHDGFPAGVVTGIVGVIELKDGRLITLTPERFRFTDYPAQEITQTLIKDHPPLRRCKCGEEVEMFEYFNRYNSTGPILTIACPKCGCYKSSLRQDKDLLITAWNNYTGDADRYGATSRI